jgi:hypothetical protein
MLAGRLMRVRAAPRAAALLLAAGLACATPAVPAAEASDSVGVARDVIVLLDITGSMRGGGTDQTARDIWDQVVEKLIQQVNDLPDGSSLAIVPFDAGPRLARVWPAAQKSASAQIQLGALDGRTRDTAINHIKGLVPDGATTGICDSLEYALKQMSGWRAQQSNAQRVETVFIYTDGLDNGRCKDNFVKRLVTVFKGAITDNPFLYGVYIDLNGRLKPADIGPLTDAGFSINTSLPDFIDVAPGPTDLAAALLDPDGTDLVLHLSGEALNRKLTARVDLLSGSAGLVITPGEITLAAEVTIHLTATQAIAPGGHAAAIVLAPITGNYQFTNSTTEFLYQGPIPTPLPTLGPTPVPAPIRTMEAVAPPVAAVPSAPLFLIPIALLILAMAVAVVAELYRRTPRFPADAVLEVEGRVICLQRVAGFAFMRPQRVIVSGTGSPNFHGTHGSGPQGFGPTTLTAIKGSRNAIFDAAGTRVTANDAKVSAPRQIAFGTRLVGAPWESRLVHDTRLAGPGWEAFYRSARVAQPAPSPEPATELGASDVAEAGVPAAEPADGVDQAEPADPADPSALVEPIEPVEARPDGPTPAALDARLRALAMMQFADQAETPNSDAEI